MPSKVQRIRQGDKAAEVRAVHRHSCEQSDAGLDGTADQFGLRLFFGHHNALGQGLLRLGLIPGFVHPGLERDSRVDLRFSEDL